MARNSAVAQSMELAFLTCTTRWLRPLSLLTKGSGTETVTVISSHRVRSRRNLRRTCGAVLIRLRYGKALWVNCWGIGPLVEELVRIGCREGCGVGKVWFGTLVL